MSGAGWDEFYSGHTREELEAMAPSGEKLDGDWLSTLSAGYLVLAPLALVGGLLIRVAERSSTLDIIVWLALAGLCVPCYFRYRRDKDRLDRYRAWARALAEAPRKPRTTEEIMGDFLDPKDV